MIKPNAISVEDMHIFASLMQMHWQISGSGIKSHAGLAKKRCSHCKQTI
jgi:hypothetical protein